MVQINIAYQGNLRCRATHGPSGSTLETDAPTDNMGKGEKFSPTDLVATALGTCMLTIMGIIAQRNGLNIEGTTAIVVKEMSTQTPRRIAKLAVNINVPATLSADDRRRLEQGALTCPVHKSLLAGMDIPVTFTWG
jgi:putative redox protein